MAWERFNIYLGPDQTGDYAITWGGPQGLQFIMAEPRDNASAGVRLDTFNRGYVIRPLFGGGKEVVYWVTVHNRGPVGINSVLTGSQVP